MMKDRGYSGEKASRHSSLSSDSWSAAPSTSSLAEQSGCSTVLFSMGVARGGCAMWLGNELISKVAMGG